MEKKSIPETSPSPWPLTRVGIKCWIWGLFFGAAIQWSFVLFDRHPVSVALGIAVTVATTGLGVMCFYYMWRWIAGLDELQRELQLKALALVFPGSFDHGGLRSIARGESDHGRHLACAGGGLCDARSLWSRLGVARVAQKLRRTR